MLIKEALQTNRIVKHFASKGEVGVMPRLAIASIDDKNREVHLALHNLEDSAIEAVFEFLQNRFGMQPTLVD